ncbi:hypothetical protein OIB37_12975 [Streptomyces sp. NBC_00820]|uniref:hypothetical protein n=1 Tax=Streptomyces sp. NBC_00820 TaxID=2975842 RepID=UPI002ED0FD0A|nr:hypothetical protein OIB37_12975 [Streptomyces sp. NBC_00820]
MTSALRHRYGRALGAGALSVLLLSGSAAGASAAAGTTGTAATGSRSSASPSAEEGSITVKAGKSSVKAGDKVTFTGRTKGLKIGTKLVLQHEKSGKWTTLKASAKVRTGSSYAIVAKLNFKGEEHLRVSAGKVHSPTVKVKVS